MGKTTPYPVGEPNFYLLSEQFPVPLSSSSTRMSSAVASSTDSSTSVASAVSSSASVTASNQTQNQNNQLSVGAKPLTSKELAAVSSEGAQYQDPTSSVPSTQESMSSVAKDECMEPLPLHAQQYPSVPPYAGSSSVMSTTTALTSHHFPHRSHSWNYYPPPIHDGQPHFYSTSCPPFQPPRYQEYFGHHHSDGYYPAAGHGAYPTVHRPYFPPPPNPQYQYYQQQQPQHSVHSQFDSSIQYPVHKQVAVEEHVLQQEVNAQHQHPQQQHFLANDGQHQFYGQPPMLPPPPPPSIWESRLNVGQSNAPTTLFQPPDSDNIASDHNSA